jgi:HAD superfamily hydrolase (TIGR01450 family)
VERAREEGVIETTPGALERLGRIRAFALDMDGTTYLGGRLLPGAADFVAINRGRGTPCVFLTNNSSRSRREYLDKLTRLGLAVGDGDVMTSGEATIRYLHRERPGARVFLVATPSFEEEVRSAGIALAPAAGADVAVLAFDTTLTFAKLADLCDAVRRGVPFVATHPDVNCPVDGGYIPDVGSFLACIEASTGRRPDMVVGKPGPLMVAALSEKLSLPPADIAYVGDRLYTDVAMARSSGMLAVLVLSGETSLSDLDSSPHRPDLVVDGLAEVVRLLGP